jgi:hypothetical protein
MAKGMPGLFTTDNAFFNIARIPVVTVGPPVKKYL